VNRTIVPSTPSPRWVESGAGVDSGLPAAEGEGVVEAAGGSSAEEHPARGAATVKAAVSRSERSMFGPRKRIGGDSERPSREGY
jgi:hypothetical protein